MFETNIIQKIDFREITLKDKDLFGQFTPDEFDRGCDFTFANLYLWGRQNIATIHDHIVLFSQFDRRSIYPFPIGNGDKKPVIDAIIADAKARGIPCRITGLSEKAADLLDQLYPDKFRFHCDEGSFDYIYDINDLADLKGKKYHGKRNHINRFLEIYPHYSVEPICNSNLMKAKEMVAEWYENRTKEDPDSDFHEEQRAISKAFRDFNELNMEGLILLHADDVLAVTMGSRINKETFDVHFEKGHASIPGAYTVINREFARYIRNKYPEILFLDREEDMGLEGLKKAKQSYHPHHMMRKYWAYYMEDENAD